MILPFMSLHHRKQTAEEDRSNMGVGFPLMRMFSFLMKRSVIIIPAAAESCRTSLVPGQFWLTLHQPEKDPVPDVCFLVLFSQNSCRSSTRGRRRYHLIRREAAGCSTSLCFYTHSAGISK